MILQYEWHSGASKNRIYSSIVFRNSGISLITVLTAERDRYGKKKGRVDIYHVHYGGHSDGHKELNAVPQYLPALHNCYGAKLYYRRDIIVAQKLLGGSFFLDYPEIARLN